MIQNKLHGETYTDKFLNRSPPLQDPLSGDGVNKVVLYVIHHAPQHPQEMLPSRTTKAKPLHKITTVAMNHHQMRNAILGDSEAMEICIRRTRAPEICRTQIIDLRLIKVGEEGCSFIRRVWNGDRTTVHFKLRRHRKKWTCQESIRPEIRNLGKKKKRETNPRGRNEERNKEKESSPGVVTMGAMGRIDTGTEGTAKTDAVNTAETGTKNTVGMGTMGVAEVAIANTPTPTAIPSPLGGSANKRNGHANKRGRVNLAKNKKKKKKREGGKKPHTNECLG